jgi:hypothetical protein
MVWAALPSSIGRHTFNLALALVALAVDLNLGLDLLGRGVAHASCDPLSAPSDKASDKAFLGVPDLSLGEAQEFSNGPEAFLCRPINWRGKTLAWVHAPFRNGKQIIATRCERNESQAFNAVTGAMIESYDDLDTQESILEWDATSKKISFNNVTLPLRHMFSNPTYCGSLVAYWGIQRKDSLNQVYAVVYDVATQRIRAKEEVGSIVAFQTDASGYLPQASWSSKGEKVDFPAMKGRPAIDIKAVTLRP